MEDISNNTKSGMLCEEKKKRCRKPKKQNQKELMEEMFDYGHINGKLPFHNDTVTSNQYCYLSVKEKKALESKFSTPKNKSQEKYVQYLNNPNKKMVIATGPAGTGKTLFAAQFAIRMFLTNQCEKIIFTRPSVSVDEDLGFLPGTLEEKMAPWMRPLYDILYAFISPKEVQKLVEEKTIEICPLGFMRGRTFKQCCIVADEMQNSTPNQMVMLMTRIGENSRLFITGDLEQCDKMGYMNGLEDFLGRFKGKRSDSISSVEFERKDIEREEVVKEVLEIYGYSEPANLGEF
jgi:phosphate starvation-inducible PhoH-like protein